MQKLLILTSIIQILAQSQSTFNQTVVLDTMPTLTPQLVQQYLSTSTDGYKYWSSELTQDQLPPSVSEYGYGFWFRFLTAYPTRLSQGKNADWYFLSRLTINKDLGDIGFGDRLLAIWQGQGFYHFTTLNTVGNLADVDADIVYPQDIEGLWTYVYYSHSQTLNRTVGFMQFGTQPSKRIQLDVTHPDIKYLKLIIGGRTIVSPGFNGQIYNIEFIVNGLSSGAFINDEAGFQDDRGTVIPSFDLNYFFQYNQVNQTQVISTSQVNFDQTVIQAGSDAFPKEYSVSGWFKWTGPFEDFQHFVFRLAINEQNFNTHDELIGDRALAVWINKKDSFHCATYTYKDMNGNGEWSPSIDENNSGDISEWHFLYYGYSKLLSKAYFFFESPLKQYQPLFSGQVLLLIERFSLSQLQWIRSFNKCQYRFRSIYRVFWQDSQ